MLFIVLQCAIEADFFENIVLLSHLISGSICDIRVVQKTSFFNHLTRMPSNLERALRGLRARRVLKDLIAVKSEYPSEFAARLIKDTYMECRKTQNTVTIQTEKSALVHEN